MGLPLVFWNDTMQHWWKNFPQPYTFRQLVRNPVCFTTPNKLGFFILRHCTLKIKDFSLLDYLNYESSIELFFVLHVRTRLNKNMSPFQHIFIIVLGRWPLNISKMDVAMILNTKMCCIYTYLTFCDTRN